MIDSKLDAHVTATLMHPHHGARVVYAGSYRNLLKSGMFESNAYVKALGDGCLIIIKPVTEEERNKAIERLEFEGSVTDEPIRKWKEE